MRIAVMIIGLFLTLIVGLQSCAITAGGGLAKNPELYGAGGAGILITFLVLLGAAFSMGLPRVAMALFGIAALIGLGVGSNTSFKDLTIWGIVALGLALMSYFGHRELRKRQARPVSAQGGAQ